PQGRSALSPRVRPGVNATAGRLPLSFGRQSRPEPAGERLGFMERHACHRLVRSVEALVMPEGWFGETGLPRPGEALWGPDAFVRISTALDKPAKLFVRHRMA